MTAAPRRIAILGSTGSIGQQTLEVVGWHPRELHVTALAAQRASDLFRQQLDRWRPPIACLTSVNGGSWASPGERTLSGVDGLLEIATDPDVDVLVVATSGTVGLQPALAALAAGQDVALANKEALIMAGHLMTAAAAKSGARILPVDSEHSAIWQCLQGEACGPDGSSVRRIILTASGGAFRDLSLDELRHVTPEAALRHPNWTMGPKITVDSATLMNKGLEVLEAACLFDVPLEAIEILVHRESIIHSLVEFVDGSMKAQLAAPDMRLPILYALSHPRRLPAPTPPLDLARLCSLTFERLDETRFRCPALAYRAGRAGGSYPAVLSAANDEAVRLFLREAIAFLDVAALIEAALDAHVPWREPGLEQVLEAEAWARTFVAKTAAERPAGGTISPAAAPATIERVPPRSWD
ncbi:MAG: 1-deoxy-D-xylulose-5-phosphate reductoisomerase [Chloroflexi bacterium]|nr:1-deoxy-D-xylulose-5-phosphate reductoisomerase [Chloroflexota bacterium]